MFPTLPSGSGNSKGVLTPTSRRRPSFVACPLQTPDRAALARERLAAKRRRVSNLRRRVVAGALATFALAWGVIAFNGSMGAEATTTSDTASTGTDDLDRDPERRRPTTATATSSDDDTVTTAQS